MPIIPKCQAYYIRVKLEAKKKTTKQTQSVVGARRGIKAHVTLLTGPDVARYLLGSGQMGICQEGRATPGLR